MKSLEEFITLFCEQFDEVDRSTITAETKFHDMDHWSSLTALSIIAMIDEEFGVIIKGDDIHDSVTIKDVYDRIIAKG